jgi:hypothetical protein
MSFDLGRGRNGPAASGMPSQVRRDVAAPYRPDVADSDFVAAGDFVVVVLAPPRQAVGSILVPEVASQSPFHVVVSVGPMVTAKTGLELEPGDVVAMAGAQFVDTAAGRVWFVKAENILSVVVPKATAERITEPPPPEDASA